jgi:Pentapeptide repeats (9 copies)
MADSLLMIKAEEILEKIEDGKPVEYENIIIFGDLDLSRLDLPLDKSHRKIIKSIIKIEYSEIKGDVFFDRSIFSKLVDFDGSTFNKAANFSDSAFMEDAGFSEAQFQGEANFSRAHFMTEANFSRAKFNGDAEFGKAKFNKNLNLASAKIYTMRLSDAAFEDGSYLYLKDLNFNRIIVRWNTIKAHIPYNGSVYLALTKNFRILEQFEDQDACYYQYRKEKQARATSLVPRALDSLAWVSCGYGVRPSRTVILSVMIMLLFTGIFWSGNAIRFDGPAAQENQTPSVSVKDTFYFSSMEFLGRSPQNMHIESGYEYLIMIETLLGWLLMALFLVTLSKVMLR